MKKLMIALCALAVISIGCGGGGGGGGSTPTPPAAIPFNISSATLSFGQQLNISAQVPGDAGQSVTFTANRGTIQKTGPNSAVYTAPNAAGTYVITATNDANSNQKGTLSVKVTAIGITINPTSVNVAPGGATDFTATVSGSTNQTVNFSATAGTLTKTAANKAHYVAPSTAGTYTVTARPAADTTQSANAKVTVATVSGNATVSGKVLLEGTTTGISGITVQFFDRNNNVVAQKATGAGGAFSVSVPTTAVRFHLLASSINTANYYESYTFNTIRYSPLIPTCTAPIPTLTAGGSVTLNTISVPSTQGPPPPPPTGCTG